MVSMEFQLYWYCVCHNSDELPAEVLCVYIICIMCVQISESILCGPRGSSPTVLQSAVFPLGYIIGFVHVSACFDHWNWNKDLTRALYSPPPANSNWLPYRQAELDIESWWVSTQSKWICLEKLIVAQRHNVHGINFQTILTQNLQAIDFTAKEYVSRMLHNNVS